MLAAPAAPNTPSGERSQSPTRSSKSIHSADNHRFGISRLKLKLGMSSETLVQPPPNTPAWSLPSTPHAAHSQPSRGTPGRHSHNVLSRLQGLFPTQSPASPLRSTTGPPVLPAPNIPTLDITHDLDSALEAARLPKQPPFLKVKIVTWNHGYTLPKGDLSTLLGNVPLYEPPADGPPTTLPIFAHDDLYHIVIVAAQECPSQSKMPLGIGPGLKRFEIRDKEKKMEKEKERLEKEHAKQEKRRSKQSGKVKDGEKDPLSQGASPNPDVPGTPLPTREFQFPMSGPPSPSIPVGSPYQHLPPPSAYSLKSLVSQPKNSPVDHHPVGWSSILEDWFCHGVGSVSGVKPAIASEISLPASIPSDIAAPQALSAPPQTSQPELDLASPARSVTPEHVPWLIPPPPTLDLPSNAILAAVPQDERGPYVLHAKERLMAIALYVFVHRDVQHLVTGTSKSAVTAGLIGGRVGNKGGVAISMKVADTTLLFVNAHLAAHEDKQAERVANMAKIKAELDVNTFLEPDDPRTVAEDITDRFDHSFIFGDLNFRLNVTRLHAEWLISRKEYATALCFDQLKAVLKTGEPFSGFEEAPINFAPTFKYDVLRTLKKHRSVRNALKVKNLKRLGRQHPNGEDMVEDESSSEDSEESSDAEENDKRSVVSSAHRSQHSRQVAEEDEDSDSHDPFAPAVLNTKANAVVAKSDVHSAALKAKEKFLSLVQRPPSPALNLPAPTPSPPIVEGSIKRPKSDPSNLKPPLSPHFPPPPIIQAAQSFIDASRSSGEMPRAPPLRRAQSTKSGIPQTKDHVPEEADCTGVYDSSSKQRVPSWCDRILFKSNVIVPEPDPEVERGTPNRFSQMLHNFKRPRKDSAQSGGSNSDSPSSLVHRSSGGLSKEEIVVTSTPPSDSPSRPSPFGRFFRQESLPNPTTNLPVSPRFDRTSSLNTPVKSINPSRSTSPNEGEGTAHRRSFSTSAVTLSPESREAPSSPTGKHHTLAHTEDVKKASSSPSTVPTLPAWRWFLHRSTATPQEISRIPTDPPPPAHQKGDIVCLKYDTLVDRQMRQLEARSDHRPVMGDFAIYV